MANGLDVDTRGFGFRSGAIYRNEQGPGEAGWYWYIGSELPRGPFGSKRLAVENRDRYLAKLESDNG